MGCVKSMAQLSCSASATQARITDPASREYFCETSLEPAALSYEDTELRRIPFSACFACALLAGLGTFVSSPALAQTKVLHGVVYADANANGKRDVSERAMSGVMISN